MFEMQVVRDMFNFIYSGGLFDDVAEILTLNPQTFLAASGESQGPVWQVVYAVYNDFAVPIGLGIMLIWFLVAFIQKAASENVTFETLFLSFTKLIVAKFLIENGLEIFASIWSFGISSINSLETLAASKLGTGSYVMLTQATKEALWRDLTGCAWKEDPGFFAGIFAMIQMFLPWAISLILVVIVNFICYSRLIEMFLRMMVAPIALADFMTEGLHSAGWKYLKSFFAIALQGALIYLISVIFSNFMAGAITGQTDFIESTIIYFVIGFSACALMFKSLTLSKELVGVN